MLGYYTVTTPNNGPHMLMELAVYTSKVVQQNGVSAYMFPNSYQGFTAANAITRVVKMTD